MSDFVNSTQRRSSWSKHQSPSGHEYYFDEDRQSSQWERPPDYISDEESPQPYVEETVAVESAVPFAASEATLDPAAEALHNEILHFEYNINVGLFYELQRLTLLSPPSAAERNVYNGQWCAITCKKLEVSFSIQNDVSL